MFKAIPLFSGSSGNCVYVKYKDEEILIDAGVSYKRICSALEKVGTSMQNIKAVFVTHEHSDHVQGLGVLSKHTDIPIFINRKSASYYDMPLDELFCGKAKIKDPGDSITFDGFEVDTFATPHDSIGSCGYHFTFSDGTRFALATDMGQITPEIASYLLGCKAVVIESNHDTKMLKNGPYPYILKKRILSDHGHLSNEDCAAFIPKLVDMGAEKIILAHLSKENNTPELCYKTNAEALAEAGFTPNDVRLTIAMQSII
ncbi:MAG: MBL fold metallo-hydrolase [Ruminococcaceae bacterium]|nr:MBL fold metallo-hydrolase [Oscillospiraceae bacterium]